MKRHLLCTALLLFAAARPAAAQPALADGAPPETVFYFGWSGTPAIEADYQASTLKRVVDLVEPEQVAKAWSRWRGLAEEKIDHADFSEGLEVALGLWGASFRGGFAAWVALGDLTGLAAGDAEDAFYAALCWRPANAADRASLIAGLERLLSEIPQAPAVLEAGEAGPVRLLLGSPANRAAAAAPASAGPGIAAHRGFARAQEAVGPGALSVWLDLESVSTRLIGLAQEDGTAPAQLFRVLEVLHPQGLRQVAVAAGFHGPGWSIRLFVDAPAPRRGLAGLLDAPPVTDADLAAVPADAPILGVWAFDLQRLLMLVRDAVRAADPQAAQQVDDAIAQAGEMIGADVDAQLLGGLGSAHVFFQDPSIAGSSGLSTVLVNRLRDPDGVVQVLAGVQNLANGMVAAYTADAPVGVQFHTTQRDGVDLHTLALPGFAPTWAVFDGRLHLGLYPQSVLAAADRRGQARSILDHPGFAAVREAAGGHQVTGLSFIDVPQTAPGSYGNLLLLEHVATGLGSMALRDPFPAVLPPFGRLEPLLAPVAAVSWADEAGHHSQGQSPFPGASLLAGQGGGGAMQVLPLIWGGVAGYMENTQDAYYDHWEATEVGAWDDPDARALQQIGRGMSVYDIDYEDQASRPSLPSDYLKDGYIPDASFFRSAFSEQLSDLDAGNVDRESDFILLPGPALHRVEKPAQTPVAIRNPAILPIEQGYPLPVLYADGHVGTVASLDELAAQYRASTGLELDEVLGAAAE